MLYQMYTIRDIKAEVYLPPFHSHNDATAKRMFTESVNDPNSPLAAHPQDYWLFAIGSYDDVTAFIDPKTPEGLITGGEALAPPPAVAPLFADEGM